MTRTGSTRPSPPLKSPPYGDHGEHQEGGDQRQVGGQLENEPVGALGDQILFEEQLDAVGQGLEDAERTRPALGPMRFCMSPMSLRSNQIISITAISRRATKPPPP